MSPESWCNVTGFCTKTQKQHSQICTLSESVHPTPRHAARISSSLTPCLIQNVAQHLIDIDWDRAVIHVSGKSRQETALPLPQDVGDALYTYISTVRPRVDEPQLDEQKVFLGVRAPHRPFSNSGVATKIARRALDRANVVTFAGRGAHVFRHSQATALLRSGATLEVIATLLRHASLNSTMVPLDNNLAERRFRPEVIRRKLSLGSDSKAGAEGMATMLTVVRTLEVNDVAVVPWLEAWLSACAANGGRPPEDLGPWLPWTMDEARQAEFRA